MIQHKNYLCVLKGSGYVHVIDVAEAKIKFKYVAFAGPQATWDSDKNQTIFFTIDENGNIKNSYSIILFVGYGKFFKVRVNEERNIKTVSGRESEKSLNASEVRMEWNCIKTFKAHKLDDTQSICGVIGSHQQNLFISGTSYGQIKIWSIWVPNFIIFLFIIF